jgi:hypothetical protein
MADKMIELSSVSAATSAARATLLTRSNLAAQLLNAAATAARTAHNIGAKDPQLADPATVPSCIQQSTVAVVMATTALEACANEIITDILDHLQGLEPEQRTEWEALKNTTKGNVLDKIKGIAKKLNNGASVEKGASPYQEVGTLLLLRNALVHFKPAWSDNKEVHESDVAKRLERAIGRSPFYKSEANFPIGYLHYSVAKWAVRTAQNASAEFSRAVGEKDRFANTGFDFSLP